MIHLFQLIKANYLKCEDDAWARCLHAMVQCVTEEVLIKVMFHVQFLCFYYVSLKKYQMMINLYDLKLRNVLKKQVYDALITLLNKKVKKKFLNIETG